MSANYRYWCGECHYRTPWLTESQGAERQIDHYAQRHPGVPPGGRVEVRQADSGYGCLALVGGLFLLLVLLSTCSSQARSAPLPASPPTAVTTDPAHATALAGGEHAVPHPSRGASPGRP
ncbi:hypothetical protein [Goodfellowiella coeruleoviolacea]|uniref:Uncharacterized protein n=1 Tax=Goodfellowiella coeruleoviolacea TaxID=334858 RepID=A0AAE3GB05_9PSEU|nr:hypothetical protein [Goodfellowiella coeruleoviolacea]MCP2164815.1 hypothetical protein [Goodfellowiella coeruleoviolacea]